MKLIFASHNENKVSEVQELLPEGIELLSLLDIGFKEDIPETAETLEGNALIKARTIYNKYSIPCFADDTGLFVDVLGGCPGVYSARFAGPSCSAQDNIEKLLSEMNGSANRNAHFKTVIALVGEHGERCFEGRVDGEITLEQQPAGGFGYDPIFKPDGFSETFSAMSSEKKNKLSHRGKAVAKFVAFLKAGHLGQ